MAILGYDYLYPVWQFLPSLVLFHFISFYWLETWKSERLKVYNIYMIA